MLVGLSWVDLVIRVPPNGMEDAPMSESPQALHPGQSEAKNLLIDDLVKANIAEARLGCPADRSDWLVMMTSVSSGPLSLDVRPSELGHLAQKSEQI